MRGKCGRCKWFSKGGTPSLGEFFYCIGAPDYETQETGKEFIKPENIITHEYGSNYRVFSGDDCHDFRNTEWGYKGANK